MQPPALKTSHLSKFQLETLFYIFYNMPKDTLQVTISQGLFGFQDIRGVRQTFSVYIPPLRHIARARGNGRDEMISEAVFQSRYLAPPDA